MSSVDTAIASAPVAPPRFRLPDFVISSATALVLLVLWETSVRSGLLDARFFPAPTKIAQTAVRLISSGQLLTDISATLVRILFGFAIGATAGVVAGLALGGIRVVRVMFEPILSALYVIPKISILPLLMIIFGLGDGSKIAVVALAAFFVIAINTMDGVRTADPVLLEAGQNFGAKGLRMFWHVLLPSALPNIFTGLKIGAGTSLLVVIAAEFVAAEAGIGFLIWRSWTTLVTEEMYVGFAVIALMGILLALILSKVGQYVMPWRSEHVDIMRATGGG